MGLVAVYEVFAFFGCVFPIAICWRYLCLFSCRRKRPGKFRHSHCVARTSTIFCLVKLSKARPTVHYRISYRSGRAARNIDNPTIAGMGNIPASFIIFSDLRRSGRYNELDISLECYIRTSVHLV